MKFTDDATILRQALLALTEPIAGTPPRALASLGYLAYHSTCVETREDGAHGGMVCLLQGMLAAAEEQLDTRTARALRTAIQGFSAEDQAQAETILR